MTDWPSAMLSLSAILCGVLTVAVGVNRAWRGLGVAMIMLNALFLMANMYSAIGRA